MSNTIKNVIKTVSLLSVDVLAFYGSLGLAFGTRRLLSLLFPGMIVFDRSFLFFLNIWWVPLIFISFLAYERLYVKKLPFWDETKCIVQAVTISAMTILAVITLGKMTGQISRLTMLFLWGYSLVLFPLFRLLGKRLLFSAGIWRDNVIIIGAGTAGLDAAKGILTQRHLGYHLIGFLDDAPGKIGTEVTIAGRTYKVFGKTKHFRKFVRFLNISTIILALPSLPVDRLAELTNHIQKYTKNILLIPDVKGVALTNTELYHFFDQQLFLLRINNNLKSPYNRFIKRSFDISLALLFLAPLLMLLGLLGLLIKLDSPGPVFYRHTRIGRGGRPIGVYKFRSMYRDSRERLAALLKADPAARSEWESAFKLKNDPRVTAMGRFLRRTSLDELPQVINVLKGEMSLVGPRPVVQEEITKFYREYADYYQLVRPGITGLWQVSGRNDLDYDVRVRLDAWYVLNWSVWLDLLMLFKTVRVVLKREGAY